MRSASRKRRVRRLGRSARFGERRLRRRQRLLAADLGPVAKLRQGRLDLLPGRVQRVATLLDLAPARGQLAALRLDLGDRRERVAKGRIRRLERVPAGALGRGRSFQLGGAPLGCRSEAGTLLVEPPAHGVGIALGGVGVGDVLVDLLAARGEEHLVLVEPRKLVDHRAQALAEPGELGRERRFALAQGRQRRRRLVAPCARLLEGGGAARDRVPALAEGLLGRRQLGARGLPAADQQGRFGLAPGGAQLAVALRLARLLAQAAMLLLERGQEVLQPDQIGFGRLQLELGLVASGLQAGDACGRLEQPPPIGGLGLDQAADLALAHDRGAARARGRIGEQQLDVARAHLAAVDPERRAEAASDPPGQLELVVVAELRPCPVDPPQLHRDVGEIVSRPRRGAGEDHVVHLAAAQAARRGLAHHPAQGLDEVRLAAAVRTHDPGQAGLDQQLGRVDERLESGQAQLGDLHRVSSR